MKSKVLKLIKKPFVRSVVIVASGTAAAQAITFIFSPIITRIYGPEAFGVWGVFMAMLAIVSPLAALTYPIAIVLPKRDSEAKSLVRLSLYTSLVVACFVILILVFFNKSIVSLLNLDDISSFLFLLPFVIIFSALLQVAQQWLIRTKQFRITAKSAFLNALVLNSAKTGFGLLNPVASVLVILTTLGSLLHATLLLIGASRSRYKQQDEINEPISLKEIVKKYTDFPLLRAPQTFIHSISQNLPVLFFASFFGPASAGFYSLGRSVLGKPIELLGKSVSDVFYPRISEAAHRNEKLDYLLIKATISLTLIGIIPFGTVIIFGPPLFEFVFGSEWTKAGEYASWLAVTFFFGFINGPTKMAIPVINLQGFYLIYEIISAVFRLGILFLSYYIFNDDVYAIGSFSLASIITNSVLIFYVVYKSKNFNVNA
ncbi:hypothetical protein BTR22_04335 [Alkalihalophilus pseudofirmus]|uniref:lipopolysaccharide biosynthesis protein n=1 Tax=Alkalihalophilus pseudofirmus TaxID=79885 RepID=UPI000952EE5F|nr:hypothetical protein BTR22_04335 [Alkalihalophilus pseudofirmus]